MLNSQWDRLISSYPESSHMPLTIAGLEVNAKVFYLHLYSIALRTLLLLTFSTSGHQ